MGPLRQVFRRLAQSPGFTAVALITLALGIGANVAIFSVVEGVLIKPLPFPRAQELVGVWHLAPGIQGINGNINCSPTMYFTYTEENRTFQDFGIWQNGGATVTGLAEPEQVRSIKVTYGLLPALGIQPGIGRWFSKEDDTPGTPETVILSYAYWQRRLGGNPSAVGKTITLDYKPHTIIGVMPADFRFLNFIPDVILPMRFEREKLFLGNFSYQGIARLKPGATIQQANADVGRMLGIWLKAWPTPFGFSRSLFENAHFAPKLQPLKQEVVGDIGNMLWVLMGTIGLVLLIACANVANLLLVRAEGRQQELAIRAALGAGWGRIAQELLLESTALAVLGGGLGLALAYGALRLLVAKGPETLPRLHEIGIDPLVLAFALAVSLLSGVAFGLIPVLRYGRAPLAGILRGGGRTLSQGRERLRARNTLVVVQVGLALVLLVGSGLMIRTFQALRNVQPGFTNPEALQLLRIFIPEAQTSDGKSVMQAQQQMMEKLAAVPGVSSVAFAFGAPMEGFNWNDLVYAQDKTYGVGEIPPLRRFRFTAPGYFKTMGTNLIAGRDFTWMDLYEKRHVAVVSEGFAREMWGSAGAALGKQIRSAPDNPWREIVGVVQDVRDNGIQEKAPPIVYWPALMDYFEGDKEHITRGGVFILRTNRAGTDTLLKEARQAIWSVNSNLPVFLIRTEKEIYDQSMMRTSFTLVLLMIAGVMALVLGIIGIYGVIAYAVSQRSREIGIRIALGAQASWLHGMFVRDGMLLAGIGAALGLAAALAMTRLMASLLFGVTALDPVAYGAASAILIMAAVLASYVPARRATAVDPVEALRAE
ncbi:MAG: ABC transporter permease [Bryobacterales bacterium]|nr:ABC transporter permease [Bryobacterales bacterium]MBV9400231.1 ABC transporter permease [Bryobacterales bacterium]